MATYLITGVAGFIGSNLAEEILRRNETVRGIDNFKTGRRDNIAGLRGLDFVEGDITSLDTMKRVMQGVDYVLHQAAIPSVPRSVAAPIDSNQANVTGTLTVLEAARSNGKIKRVVYAASSSAYGDTPTLPKVETMPPRPRSPYAVSKLAAEYYVRTIGGLWGIETVCLRVFNAYGPGQHIPPVHAPVIPQMLRNARLNGTIVVHGDGNQTRDYVYIDDVVNAMVSASSALNINQQIINIGSGRETSVRELVRMVMELTGSHPEVVYNPRTESGPAHMCADLTLARERLGYQTTIALEMGLRITMERDARLK